jgi:hypothetical protein
MPSSSSIRFRPLNPGAFTDYAKHLAWLLEAPLQRSQELLARIYGYADVHELQQVLQLPATAGPFTGDDRARDRLRLSRIRAEVAEFQKKPWTELTQREQTTASMALFAPPAVHRERFAMLSLDGMFDDQSGYFPIAHQGLEGVDAYGRLVTYRGWPGIQVMQFTALGAQVLAQHYEIAASTSTDEEHDRLTLPLLAEHPDHAWLHAYRLTLDCRYAQKQTPWFLGSDLRDGSLYEATAAIEAQPERANLANALVPQLQPLWETFDRLRSSQVLEPELLQIPAQYDKDYHDFLLFTHYVAFNAGRIPRAVQLLEQLWSLRRDWARALPKHPPTKLDYGTDDTGVRFNLVPLLLSLGRPWMRYMDEVPTDVGWAHFASSLAAYEQGALQVARIEFAKTLQRCPWFAGLFVPLAEGHEGWKTYEPTWRDTPVGCAEFDHRLAGFWARVPHAREFFRQRAQAAMPALQDLGDAILRVRAESKTPAYNSLVVTHDNCWVDKNLDLTGCDRESQILRLRVCSPD